jgi:LemA protein
MIAFWIILVLIVVLVLVGIGVYNGLIRQRNKVENAWSQIDVQLKRRVDLIPNLVETVKGYAAHERETLDAVVRARNAAIAAPSTPGAQAQANTELTGALRQLFALSEAYPDLKANQNFLALQEELTATEGRVAYARQFYNDSVLGYNNKLDTFPSTIFARMMHLQRREYFEVDDASRDAPQVEFGTDGPPPDAPQVKF